MSLTDWRSRRRERWADEHEVDALCWSWRTACVGAGLCHLVPVPAGVTESVPPLVHITLGPPRVLVAELLAGQLVSDVRAVAHRLAGPLGAVALRCEPLGLRHVRIELLTADPLAGTVPRAPAAVSGLDPLTLGRGEDGRPVTIELGSAAHLICQGASGSGKSVAVYGWLGQLAAARDVLVAGSDITGLLLAPWATRPDSAGWHALGTRNPAAHVDVLEAVVREMDRRVASLPPGHDSLPLGPDRPLLLAIVEETPGLYRVLASADKDLEKRARALVARLLGEGRKAGVRVLLITQRADASIIGGYERGQASHTLSFRVDTLSALSMLHADVDRVTATAHATAAAGVGLLSAPGTPLRRLRAPLTTYAAYCADVAGTGGSGGLRAK